MPTDNARQDFWAKLAREDALRPRMEQFHKSQEMRDRVRDLLERQYAPYAKGKLVSCRCMISSEIIYVFERKYVYRIVRDSLCQMHPVGEPIRFLAVQSDEGDPFNADKVQLHGIENTTGNAAIAPAREEFDHHRNHLTRYKDIEAAHEDEEDANFKKFNPPKITPEEEVTLDNWMKFI